MVMVRRGSQDWREVYRADDSARPFTRTDGSVMSEEEIKKVAAVQVKIDPQSGKHVAPGDPKSGRGIPISDAELDRAWEAVKEHRTQAAAAAALGMRKDTLQYRLAAYMKHHGLKGALPGVSPRSARTAVVSESQKQTATASVDNQQTDRASANPEESLSRESANEPSPEPVIELVVHQDGEAHAHSYNQGYDEAMEHMAELRRASQSDSALAEFTVKPLFDWLTVYGPTWTQAQAERWFKALTSTIDLVYPTPEDVA